MICKKCKINKSTKDFVPRFDKDPYKSHSMCIKCWRENHSSNTLNYREKKREIIRAIKDVPCMDCGVKYPHYIMEFDHVRGKKKFIIGSYGMRSAKIDDVLEEIKKCDIVCSNCHRERSQQREWTKWRKEKTPSPKNNNI